MTRFLLATHNLYRRGEVNYSLNPHIRTYSYGLSLIRLLLAIHNLAKCCTEEVKYATVKTCIYEPTVTGSA